MLRRSTSFSASILGVAALLFASAASATDIPLGSMDYSLEVGGSTVWGPVVAGSQDPANPNLYRWSDGSWTGTGVLLEWSSVTGDLDPFVSGNWAITNTSAVTQIFTLIVDLPVAPVLPSSLMYGSSSITVSDANGDGGASLSSNGASALYNGRIDFSAVAPATNLFGPGYTLSAGLLATSSATQSFGIAPGSIAGPGVSSAIGIVHFFSLSAGDRATFNSTFSVVVPEPTTVMLLGAGLVALAVSRRRAA